MVSLDPIIYIVDDDQAVCDSLAYLLRSVHLTASVFSSPLEFLSNFDPNQFSCILLDVRMPKMGGMELLEKLHKEAPEIPIILISGYADVPTTVRAMKMGAFYLLEKPINNNDLIKIIQEAIRIGTQKWQKRLIRLQLRTRLAAITDREMEIIAQIIAGKRSKEIASQFGISAKTVEVHRANIMTKTQCKSVAELLQLVWLSECPLSGLDHPFGHNSLHTASIHPRGVSLEEMGS